jgi:hypothetical protein
MKRHWYTIFIVVSIAFLIIKLVHSDYLFIPDIRSYPLLCLSLISLFMGFILETLTWMRILKDNGYTINIYESLTSTGLSILGKYIPGKVWTIVGKAGYLVDKKKFPKDVMTSLSFNQQILALWFGILLGIVSLVNFHIPGDLVVTILVSFILLSSLLFLELPFTILKSFIEKVFGKKVDISSLTLKSILRASPYVLLNWFFWCAGFGLFVASLTGSPFNLLIGFGFALAGTIGILALFAPGGIGIREGILVALLVFYGLSAREATTIAVSSRLWFLVGEVFYFLISLFASKKT